MQQLSRPAHFSCLLLLLFLAACAPPALEGTVDLPIATSAITDSTIEPVMGSAAVPTSTPETFRMGRGMGGPGSSMMRFHHAQIPDAFAGLTNPVNADAESLARGEELYASLCASCHGETGMGEGAAGQALNPPVSPIADTSQMMSDAYLFWRITEGGLSFETAMPAWKAALEEESRWDVINYMRNLGTGDDMARGLGGGQGMGRTDESAHHAEMLAVAIDVGLITQLDAELFERVHAVLDEHYRANEAGMDDTNIASKQTMQRAMTGQAVRDGYITEEEADRFTEIHDALLEAGIM